jgi:hypothetical protein
LDLLRLARVVILGAGEIITMQTPHYRRISERRNHLTNVIRRGASSTSNRIVAFVGEYCGGRKDEWEIEVT